MTKITLWCESDKWV